MTLTAAECRIAAERARKYPPGYGHSYIAIEPIKLFAEELCGCTFSLPVNLGSSDFVAELLRKHPEYVEKGCPAIAVAAVRGDLTRWGIDTAFIDTRNSCGWVRGTYCTHLTGDPLAVAAKLEDCANRLEADSLQGKDV